MSELTETNIYDNIKRMLKTALVPFLLSCGIYAALGMLKSGGGVAGELWSLYGREMALHWVMCLPAVLILALSLLRVKVKRADGCVLLSVEDNGVGIAPEQQEKVFNRFYQADAARSGEGTGLGLAMAREIARLHGGDIRVTSEPGKGSIFVFGMPEKNSAL